MYYALVMAGGSGTRLWPLSRRLRPKQALRLVGERLIATIGVDNLVIVHAGDALLICSRAREQDVRRVVKQLKSDGLNQWL